MSERQESGGSTIEECLAHKTLGSTVRVCLLEPGHEGDHQYTGSGDLARPVNQHNPPLTPDEVETGRRDLIAELQGGLKRALTSVVELDEDTVRSLVAVLEALKPVVVDREWWITTGPFNDPLCRKIAGPFVSQDEAIENRVRVEEYTTPVSFWVDSPNAAEARAALYPKATEGKS